MAHDVGIKLSLKINSALGSSKIVDTIFVNVILDVCVIEVACGRSIPIFILVILLLGGVGQVIV